MSQYYNLRSTINSALKCRSHKNRLFSSILFFKSGVISLVHKTTRSHSLRAVTFNAFVSSPSVRPGKGILNNERLLFRLVEQPKSAQLAPGIALLQKKILKFARESSLLEDFGVAIFASHITTYFLFVTHALNLACDLNYREQ